MPPRGTRRRIVYEPSLSPTSGAPSAASSGSSQSRSSWEARRAASSVRRSSSAPQRSRRNSGRASGASGAASWKSTFSRCQRSGVMGEAAGSWSALYHRQACRDVLVNNAGVNAYFEATAMTEAEWDAVFAVDLKGAWLCCKHALPAMKRGGAGSIVNIASIHASLTIAGMFPYAAAKSGLVGLTRSLALDYAPANIRVNAVLPGWTRTRLVEEWFRRQPDPAAAERQVLGVHPLRRIATPAEIANLVAFVAS